MLDEPHYPSKWTAAIVLLVIVLMIGGVFVWAFWLNTGSIRLSADRPFTIEVNSETIDCSDRECSLSLPPKVYPIIAHAEGSYEEKFSIEIERWGNLRKAIQFRVIPFLKPIFTPELPAVVTPSIYFSKLESGQTSLVRNVDGKEEVISSFESLLDPKVQAVGDLAIVTDQGRIFFVTISDGRKLRRFDDSVVVQQALMSDNGKKILFFVNSNGLDQLWLWFNETSQLTPLTWYTPPTLVQWESGADHRLFVVSDILMPTNQASTIDQVLTSVDVAKNSKLLLQVNLDTAEMVQLAVFEDTKSPQSLQRRGDRYLIEYPGGLFDELITQ